MLISDLPPDFPAQPQEIICSESADSFLPDFANGFAKTFDLSGLISSGTLGWFDDSLDPTSEKAMRNESVKEAGFSYGAQGGFYARINEIKKSLRLKQDELDRVFDFSQLMLNAGKVLPPVISEDIGNFNIKSGRDLSFSEVSYKIDKPARFVSGAPNWRNYLFLSTPMPPELPGDFSRPETSGEERIWADSVKKGWVSGFCRADKAYAGVLSELEHDYSGMVLYHLLLRKDMVSLPFVTATDAEILRSRDGSDLVIGAQTLKIAAMPGFTIESGDWNSVIQKDSFFSGKDGIKSSGVPIIRDTVNPQFNKSSHIDQDGLVTFEDAEKEHPEMFSAKPVSPSLKKWRDRFNDSF